MSDRSLEFWTPDPVFRGQRVFILAGGSSLRGFDASVLKGRSVMTVNMSYRLAPKADVLYFNDATVYERFSAEILALPQLVVTASRSAKRQAPDKLHRIALEQSKFFPLPGSDVVRWGRTSGHIAVSLAIAMEAKEIVLLGYDMKEVQGRTHHHDEYRQDDHHLYASEFIPYFAGWNEQALASGVRVVNATPGSALKEFPCVALEDYL